MKFNGKRHIEMHWKDVHSFSKAKVLAALSAVR
jgi:hypothetical protein